MRMTCLNKWMQPFILVSLLSACMLVFFSCDSSDPAEVDKDFEILIPKTGETHASYNSMYLLVKYDQNFAADPQWEYSLDSGISWKPMETYISKKSSPKADNSAIVYDIKQWIPEDDTLSGGTTIYMKANSYGNSALNEIIGPIYLE
ncbi:MAG: hypothetical protein V1769_03355 [Thermoplasmatota archaeon]